MLSSSLPCWIAGSVDTSHFPIPIPASNTGIVICQYWQISSECDNTKYNWSDCKREQIRGREVEIGKKLMSTLAAVQEKKITDKHLQLVGQGLKGPLKIQTYFFKCQKSRILYPQ
jgi:hypothetical protein